MKRPQIRKSHQRLFYQRASKRRRVQVDLLLLMLRCTSLCVCVCVCVCVQHRPSGQAKATAHTPPAAGEVAGALLAQAEGRPLAPPSVESFYFLQMVALLQENGAMQMGATRAVFVANRQAGRLQETNMEMESFASGLRRSC